MYRTIFEILKNTPLWVLPLFIFLLYRGILAMNTRALSVANLFILPCLFAIWSLHSFYQLMPIFEFKFFVILILFIIAGLLTGWLIFKQVKGLELKKDENLIVIPGGKLTLIIILLKFIVTYSANVMMGFNPNISENKLFVVVLIAIYAILLGVLWGRLLNIMYRIR